MLLHVSQGLTITTLARRTGTSAKTLRYWEEIGLLPAAARSHSGYRLFSPESVQYIEFIKKSKTIGLTLKEIKTVFQLARRGQNPCPEVAKWVEQKSQALGDQIRVLQELKQRLDKLNREWSRKPVRTCFRAAELCCLIEDLPDASAMKGGKHNAKAVRVAHGRDRSGNR